MSFNIAGSSTSVPVDLPTVEEVRGFNAEELNGFLKGRLNIDSHIDTLTAQEVDGGFYPKLIKLFYSCSKSR